MAEIVQARDTVAPGQPVVAVKRILPHLCDDQQYKTMFLDESRVLAQLEHENIIQTFEIGEAEGTPYIALEYVNGQDARMLFHRMRKLDERVPIPVACFIVAKLCEGLHHAHEQTDAEGALLGLVHRDVSLQNVLLSYDGDVKVTDFGIAMSTENVARTEAGIVKGKFGYMSPEQIKGAPLDRRSDVFAAGICLYELLTGERLFSGDSDYKAVERVRNADVSPPSAHNRLIPSSLERIVRKALAKHPRDRYQSANDMRRALLAFIEESGEPGGAAELGALLRRAFAEEHGGAPRRMDDTPISRASVPPKPPTTLPGPAAPPAAAPTPAPLPVAAPVPRQAPVIDAATGLAAFDNLDPVSALHLEPPRVMPAPLPAPVPAYTPPARAPVAAPVVSVPPIVPRPGSIPGVAAPAVSTLGMDWDEEEPATQSLGFDEVAKLPETEPGEDDVTRQVRVDETFPGLDADASGVYPPSLGLPEPAAPAAPILAPFARGEPTADRYYAPEPAQRSYLPVVAVVVGIVAVIAAGLYAFGEHPTGTIRLATEPKDAIVTLDGRPVAGTRSPFVISGVDPSVPHTLKVSKPGFTSWSSALRVRGDQVLDLPAIALEPSAGVMPSPSPAAVAAPAAQAPAPVLRPAPERRAKPSPAAVATPARSPRPPPSPTPPPAPPRPKPQVAEKPVAGRGTLRINSRPWSRVFVDGKPMGNTPLMNVPLPAGSHKVKLVNPDFHLTKTLTIELRPGEVVTKIVNLQE